MKDEDEVEDRVPELPEIPQLQHLAKNRPRRPKRHASSGSIGQVVGTEADAGDLKEGLDNFFTKNVSPKLTPVGSPLLEDGLHNSRHGSISSNSSSFSRSREDIRDTKHVLKGGSGKVSPLTLDPGGRKSPAEPEDKPRIGLSCLVSSTQDEDREPLSVLKSPEKKSIISPSGRSISDIFGKVAQEKIAKNRTTDKLGPGPSPFAARRSETEVFSARRRSFFTGEPEKTDKAEDRSPEEAEGDGVVRRGGGKGLGGDILKEMKVRQELKRASIIPKSETSADKSEGKEDEKPFGNIHLRNTGLSTSISNPSNQSQPIPDLQKNFVDEPKTSETETIKHSSSSIIGLRAAAFEAGKSKSEDTDELNKPRPPPKPRPWSIVGVDRKSGEYTQLESSATAEGSISAEKEENTSGPGAISSVRDRIASLNKPDSPGSASSVAPTNIRDRIANMNKNSELEVNKRKGNSLPRSTEPVSKSPGTRPKNSPNNRKKDSTSDDPRILKLDDDFMYDDTVNV